MPDEPVLNTLLPEILGFHPQLLLDDIINAANEPIYQCTEFVSSFMLAWAEERAQRSKINSKKDQEEISMEIEQGLVAFQTLLESHVDLAFDYFEVWTLRNIFFIPPDIKVIAPHQKGFNLHHEPQEEADLFNEIEELRKKLQNRRRLNRLLKRALTLSRSQLAFARSRFESVSFLPSRPVSPTAVETIISLTSESPDLDLISPDAVSLMVSSTQLHDPSKRPWEQGKVGYDHWAISRLIERTQVDDQDPQIADAQREAVGDVDEIWTLQGTLEAEKATRPLELDSLEPPASSKKRKIR